MQTPVGQTDQFQQTWQALMRQLETVLSLANRRTQSPTETAEAVNIAQYHLKNIASLISNTTPEG